MVVGCGVDMAGSRAKRTNKQNDRITIFLLHSTLLSRSDATLVRRKTIHSTRGTGIILRHIPAEEEARVHPRAVRETTMQIIEVLLDDQVPLLLNSLGECYLAVVEKEVGGGKKLKGFKGR